MRKSLTLMNEKLQPLESMSVRSTCNIETSSSYPFYRTIKSSGCYPFSHKIFL